MDHTFRDPKVPTDGDVNADFAGNGILAPAVDLGWKAAFAGFAVGLFGAKFYWSRAVPRWPNIFALTASYGAMGASFGAVRGLSEDLRQIDGPVNWFNGGFAAGVINGLRLRNVHAGVVSALGFGGFLALVKGTNSTYFLIEENRMLTAPERDARRAAMFIPRPLEQSVNMTVFGDKADEVRKEIRRQVENREGIYSKLRD